MTEAPASTPLDAQKALTPEPGLPGRSLTLSESEPRILVIGAGPAGLSAAVTAAELGLRVLLVDEAPEPGGVYLTGSGRGHGFHTKAECDGELLLARVKEQERAGRIELWRGATVWNLDSDLTAMVFRGGAGRTPRGEQVCPGAIVLATGAREIVAPFPGWTLPGVMTVGAVQLLAKRYGVLPRDTRQAPDAKGLRVLLAGSGLLLLPAAARLAELGAHVVGVLEATRPSASWIRRAGGWDTVEAWAPSLWERRDEARHYLSAIRRHRIPYLFGRAVVRARAATTGYLEGVDVARLDGAGAPVSESTEAWPVDLLCVGYGLVPNVELAQLAGARLTHDAALGGWAVEVDERSHVRTSVPGLLVAGETAGVSGAGSAILGGKVAAMSAAVYLGQLPESSLEAVLTRTEGQRRRYRRFGAGVNLLFGAPLGLYRAMPDETPVCRCEEVTAGQVRAAISTAAVSAGALSLDGLKPAVRVGQGLCQGRTCGPIVAQLIATMTDTAPKAAGLFKARPPVKPVTLAAISERLQPEERSALLHVDGRP